MKRKRHLSRLKSRCLKVKHNEKAVTPTPIHKKSAYEARILLKHSAIYDSPVEMSPDEFLNSILALSMEVLKLVHGGELLNIEPVRSDDVCVQGRKKELNNE